MIDRPEIAKKTPLNLLTKRIDEVDLGRKAPQSVELEKAVLCAIIIDKESLIEVSDLLKPESFYLPSHQKIYSAFLEISKNDTPLDIAVLADQLSKSGELEMCGGAQYLIELSNTVASSANIIHHAHIVEQKYIQREFIRLGNDLIKKGYDSTEDVFDTIDFTEKELEKFNYDGTSDPIPGSEIIGEYLEKVNALKNNPNKKVLTGLNTGFSKLNEITGGWQPGDLIYIPARPSNGKTALMNKLMVNCNEPVLCFSLEMPSESLVSRIVSAENMVDLKRLKNGSITDDEFSRILQNTRIFDKIMFEDTPGLTISQIKRKARKIMKISPFKLICIDYVQYIRTTREEFRGNREAEIAYISRELKALAKSLNVPIIALAQIGRQADKSKDKRPTLADIRESGAIENDGDLIIILSRPDRLEDDPKDIDGHSLKGKAIIDVAKNRNGETDEFVLDFLGEYTLFKDTVSQDYNYKPISSFAIHQSPNFDDNFKGDDEPF